MHPLDALMNLINPPGGSQPGAAAQGGQGPGAMDWLAQFHNLLSRGSGGWLGSSVPVYDNNAAHAPSGYSWQDIAAQAAQDAAKAQAQGKIK